MTKLIEIGYDVESKEELVRIIAWDIKINGFDMVIPKIANLLMEHNRLVEGTDNGPESPVTGF